MFRLVNVNGRPALERDGSWYDLAELPATRPRRSTGAVAGTASCTRRTMVASRPPAALADRCSARRCPDRAVFGIGLNYHDHAGESGVPLPPAPLTFTKFPSCIAGPTADVPLSGDMVDWEVELVVVIGDGGHAASTSTRRGATSPASCSARTSLTAPCR